MENELELLSIMKEIGVEVGEDNIEVIFDNVKKNSLFYVKFIVGIETYYEIEVPDEYLMPEGDLELAQINEMIDRQRLIAKKTLNNKEEICQGD